MNKGKVIVIDGLDGCGKSTQIRIIMLNLSVFLITQVPQVLLLRCI
jgi:thymidylate kinase